MYTNLEFLCENLKFSYEKMQFANGRGLLMYINLKSLYMNIDLRTSPSL